ncbi:MAG: hypothetical protein Q7V05_16380 [Methanoregula sp.]|nr:hypothetical protein [Methanoregula sp.]
MTLINSPKRLIALPDVRARISFAPFLSSPACGRYRAWWRRGGDVSGGERRGIGEGVQRELLRTE